MAFLRWSGGSALRQAVKSLLGRGEWKGMWGRQGRGYCSDSMTDTYPVVVVLTRNGEGAVIRQNQFDAVDSLLDLEQAVVADKASVVQLKSAFQSGWGAAVIKYIRGLERESKDALSKLAAAEHRWGALSEEAREKAEETTKVVQGLKDRYSSLVYLNSKHVTNYIDAISDLERKTGQSVKKTVLEATAGEILKSHLAGEHSHSACIKYLTELESAGVITKEPFSHPKTGAQCYRLTNPQFSKWSVIAHLARCEDGALLCHTCASKEGVPIVQKRLGDLQRYIESNAQVIWTASHMPHHLLDPNAQKFILWRGDQEDEETLLLASCFEILGFPYEIRTQPKHPFLLAGQVMDEALRELEPHLKHLKPPKDAPV
ncbi:hypothetical protein KFL_006270030 [Klebsormidium nitens]|uniref:Uncharacterized protein n=1 Tax=Klebsormidium nitens TaxID=105231 RepID=A0A1Y1IMF0_KLENI|nr:hypothetical protein KFL_006270030 [Klebsormidium nitens]|eukprot:GAQ90321.1 hypothetical protein KFL_006270030 [Klebsormidium nitens]